jgi:UDP-N-acetyl-D-glucosamine dehydrogenase
MKKKLIEKIKNRKSKIGIIGLGYVGLPLAIRFAEVGFKVFGFDIDVSKIQKLSKNESYIDNIESSQILKIRKRKTFSALNDFSLCNKMDALIICVPTPLKNREPDLSFIIDTMNSLSPYLRKGQILSLESTTYPGTTDEELYPRIKKLGLNVGSNFFLTFSPEREDPGNLKFNTKNIPKIVGGHTKNCLEVGSTLYNSCIDKVIPVSSTKIAEMSKLLENIFRSVNVSLVNELKIISDKMNIDIHEVIKAASTKPFGFMPFYPGPGLGGHCIPIDPFYLTWKAKQEGVKTRFIQLSGVVNSTMPKWIINKIMENFKKRKLSLKKTKILVLGIAFKKNVSDTRESPGVKLIKLLKKKCLEVHYSDPHVPIFPKMRKYSYNLKSVNINASNLKKYDLVLITTDHTKFNFSLIKKYSKCIVDTRGVYPGNYKHIIKA